VDKSFNKFQIINSESFFISFSKNDHSIRTSPKSSINKKKIILKIIEYFLNKI
jgi:hypothetical protein